MDSPGSVEDASCQTVVPRRLKVGFGILAWNEASSIGATLASLGQQSIALPAAKQAFDRVQFAVVVNGSTDGTAEQARQAIDILVRAGSLGPQVTFEIYELEVANRQAAWNHFVHEAAATDADYLGMMDADIVLASRQSLEHLIKGLEQSPDAQLAAAQPIKDFSRQAKRGWLSRISTLGTNLAKQASQPCVKGGLYLGRAAFLRRLRVPYGLCADDGMFSFLAWTDFLTKPINPERIAVCDDATYKFEAYESLKDLWRQHRRRHIGGMMRKLVNEQFQQQTDQYSDAAEMITAKFTENPNWLLEVARGEAHRRGWRAMGWKPNRLTQLAYQPPLRAALLSPIAVAFTGWSLLTSWAAYKTIKYRPISDVWAKQGNRRLVASADKAGTVEDDSALDADENASAKLCRVGVGTAQPQRFS